VTRVVGQLMLFNVLIYVITRGNPVLYGQLALIPDLVLVRPWTLITYQFLHDPRGLGHIFFNMLGLFFFGPRLELRLGSRRFLGLYLVSGLVGALVHIAYTLLPIGGGANIPMVGASGAVFGVFFGYARFWPRDKILLFFVIPVEIRTAVIGFTVVSLLQGFGAVGNVAHFAHLGGFLGGWLYLRTMERRSPARQFQKKVESPGVRMGERALQDRWSRIDADGLHPVNREEYERIAEKLRTEGWGTLSDRERTFIERFGGAA